jgi:hypothetical protein
MKLPIKSNLENALEKSSELNIFYSDFFETFVISQLVYCKYLNALNGPGIFFKVLTGLLLNEEPVDEKMYCALKKSSFIPPRATSAFVRAFAYDLCVHCSMKRPALTIA